MELDDVENKFQEITGKDVQLESIVSMSESYEDSIEKGILEIGKTVLAQTFINGKPAPWSPYGIEPRAQDFSRGKHHEELNH